MATVRGAYEEKYAPPHRFCHMDTDLHVSQGIYIPNVLTVTYIHDNLYIKTCLRMCCCYESWNMVLEHRLWRHFLHKVKYLLYYLYSKRHWKIKSQYLAIGQYL